MKDINSKIYYVKNDNGYFKSILDYPLNQSISKFWWTYKHIINEWNSELFTPYELLQDIIKKINNDNHNYGIVIEYSLSDILNISTINWKYYQQFYNISKTFKNPSLFKFYIIYFKQNLNKILNLININQQSKNNILNTFSNKELKAINFNNSEHLEYGCCIILNGNLINNTDNSKLEYHLDHEINHYFDKFNFDKTFIINDIQLSDKIIKIAMKAGYSLKTKDELDDFIIHILNNSEFLEMCCDTVNGLKLYLNNIENKFNWFLIHSTSAFISSIKYKQLPIEIQNILLFSTIVRIYSNKHWKFLTNHIKKELNVKNNIINNCKSYIYTLIERLKN